MPLVAAEEFVGPLADQRHLDILARPLADEVHRNDRGGGDRLLEATRRSPGSDRSNSARSSLTGT